jgi:hypothetical protein
MVRIAKYSVDIGKSPGAFNPVGIIVVRHFDPSTIDDGEAAHWSVRIASPPLKLCQVCLKRPESNRSAAFIDILEIGDPQ